MEQMNQLLEVMGAESLLSELLKAMPEFEQYDYADWIARMNDLDSDIDWEA